VPQDVRRCEPSTRPGAYRTAGIGHPLLQAGHGGSIDLLRALVDSAISDDELDFVGAAPLEDLLSHNHHGAAFVDEWNGERQQLRFRKALTGVWLAQDVPESVGQRLGSLGARLL
jgi:hypothetical protein